MTDTPQASPRLRAPMKAKITTMGDVAEALGIHHHFLYAANNACYGMRECGRDKGDLDMGCDAIVALEWCKVNDCSEGFLTKPVYNDPCIDDMRFRPCDDVQRATECPGVEKRGLILHMDVWPEGEVTDPYLSL